MKSKRRAVFATLFVAAFAMVAVQATALAETAKARRTANVYVKRGERSKVVTTVRSGKRLTVIGRKGRWLKVRVNGKTGWIVRSNIESSAKARDSKDRKTRRRAFVSGRSRKRDLRRRSAPKDRYGLDATSTDADSDDFEIEDDGTTAKRKTKKKKTKKKRKKTKKKKRADNDEEDDFDDEDLEDDEEILAGDDDEDVEDDEEDDGGPEYVIAKGDIDLRAAKKKNAEEVSFAEPGEKLEVVERDGDWVKVSTADGETGWVPADKVRGPGESDSKYAFSVRGALGYGAYSQSFSSDSAMLFGNYDIGAAAMVVGAVGEMLYDYSADYMLGAELDVGYSLSTPGIRVEEGDNAADTGFSIIDATLAAKAGKKLHAKTGTVAYLRLGYRYQSFQIKNVQDINGTNLAALPSENLTSPVLGLELAVPRLTGKMSAHLVLDTMLVGASRSQTAGLEDGQASRAKALVGGAVVTYDYKPNLTLLGSYNYHWAKTEWDGAANSMRKHDATEAERADATHVLSVGVAKGF